MTPAKTDMIPRLRRDILIRQGLKKTGNAIAVDMGLGSVHTAFPDQTFPLAAVHEFTCADSESKTATAGFIAGLLSPLMKPGGTVLWIAPAPILFPPALAMFGIRADRIIFVNLSRPKDLLWMMEEALRCDSLAAVVGEISNLDFTASRRLQLSVEQSKVTGFVIRQTPYLNTTACVSRWRITSSHSVCPDGMPGIGFPRWEVELLKIRNGRPGKWTLEWSADHFEEIITAPLQEELITVKTA